MLYVVVVCCVSFGGLLRVVCGFWFEVCGVWCVVCLFLCVARWLLFVVCCVNCLALLAVCLLFVVYGICLLACRLVNVDWLWLFVVR